MKLDFNFKFNLQLLVAIAFGILSGYDFYKGNYVVASLELFVAIHEFWGFINTYKYIGLNEYICTSSKINSDNISVTDKIAIVYGHTGGDACEKFRENYNLGKDVLIGYSNTELVDELISGK